MEKQDRVEDLIENAIRSVLTPEVVRPDRVVVPSKPSLVDLSTTLNVFGIPVIVAGDPQPFKGHLYSFSLLKTGGDELLKLDVGFFEVWARVYQDNRVYEYPVVVNGLPTLSLFTIASMLERGARVFYYLLGNPHTETLVVRKDEVLLLDAVTQNKLPVLIVDQSKALCSESHEEAVTRTRTAFVVNTLNKYYHECMHELEYMRIERSVNLSRLARCESLLHEYAIRFEEARNALLELELEYRAYKTALEVYKRQYATVEDYASAVASRARELEERLKQAIETFQSLARSLREALTAREAEKPKEVKQAKKEESEEAEY